MTVLNGGHSDEIIACCFTNISMRAVTAGGDRLIKIWDISKGVTSEKVSIFYKSL